MHVCNYTQHKTPKENGCCATSPTTKFSLLQIIRLFCLLARSKDCRPVVHCTFNTNKYKVPAAFNILVNL